MSLDISNQLGHSRSMSNVVRKFKRHYEIVGTEPFDPKAPARAFVTAGAAYVARDLWWDMSRRYRTVTMTMKQKEI